MGGHTTNGPRDGCPTEVEFGLLQRVEPFAYQPAPTDRRIPASGAESGMECGTRRNRNRLKGTPDDVYWMRSFSDLRAEDWMKCTNQRRLYLLVSSKREVQCEDLSNERITDFIEFFW